MTRILIVEDEESYREPLVYQLTREGYDVSAAATGEEGLELFTKGGIDLVLLAGDLFDSAASYRDTAEELSAALGQMEAQVYIAPGNHDWYGPGSPYLTGKWPENVHIFTQPRLETMEWPEKNLVLHGAAFTHGEQADGFLTGFTAPADGKLHIGLLHGEIDPSEARYNPIRKEEIAASGLAYLALGHIHQASGLLRCGKTCYAWPGCAMGRGFDELGQKGVYLGEISDSGVRLDFLPLPGRKYEILRVEAGNDALSAVTAALPEDTQNDIYRVLLTGEAEPVDVPALQAALAPRFYALTVRDETRPRRALWEGAEEDTLRGLFLQALKAQYDAAQTEADRRKIALAARCGCAAMDGREAAE